jgi:GNAT superfamily N-acetyltransferase
MEDEYRIIKIIDSDQIPWGIIGGGINTYNTEKAGDDQSKRVCFVLQDSDGEILGGVIGVIYWDWFSLDLMWLKEEYRGLGYGGRLLSLAEDEARQLGAKHIHLDTFSFQASEFYIKHDYQVFGELSDFPKGHQRYYLKKEL